VIGVSVCVFVCVYLSASISQKLHVRSLPNFLTLLSMAVVRSATGDVVIRRVLPVSLMTSFCRQWPAGTGLDDVKNVYSQSDSPDGSTELTPQSILTLIDHAAESAARFTKYLH